MPFFPAGGSGGGGGGGSMRNDQFTATPAQTLFVLAVVPTSAVILVVDGVVYENGVNFTVVGANLTWADTPFAMAGGEEVQAFYVV